MKEMNEPSGVRLAKRVAAQAGCSRREAELLIENGAVKLDGHRCEIPQQRVRPDQIIAVDQQAKAEPVQAVTLLLHKPPRIAFDAPFDKLIMAAKRSQADQLQSRRPTLQRHFANQLCFTPLETGASGLIVFTQDPRIERKLREDAGLMENELMVDVTGVVSPEALRKLNESPVIDGRAMLPCKVSIGRQSERSTGLRFAMKGAWQGQVAQMCDAAQLSIVSMKRIRVGRVPLSGLEVGEWRYLLPDEKF